jgi:hypothetical protein
MDLVLDSDSSPALLYSDLDSTWDLHDLDSTWTRTYGTRQSVQLKTDSNDNKLLNAATPDLRSNQLMIMMR